MSARVLTCVYCGQEYPQDTPAWGSDILTEHIKVCPAHPMRKAEAEIAAMKDRVEKAEAERDVLAHKLYFYDLLPCDEYVMDCPNNDPEKECHNGDDLCWIEWSEKEVAKTLDKLTKI